MHAALVHWQASKFDQANGLSHWIAVLARFLRHQWIVCSRQHHHVVSSAMLLQVLENVSDLLSRIGNWLDVLFANHQPVRLVPAAAPPPCPPVRLHAANARWHEHVKLPCLFHAVQKRDEPLAVSGR